MISLVFTEKNKNDRVLNSLGLYCFSRNSEFSYQKFMIKNFKG